jgi:large subunit ribosomal protein L13
MATTKIVRKIHKVDAEGEILGRLATKIATWLRGKHKPGYLPYVDGGDIVEVLNVAKMKVTGKKLAQKRYYHYSGWQSGLKERKLSELMVKNPSWVLKRAVREMLPDNRLRSNMIKRLIIK